MLLKEVGIDGRHHDVVLAVDDKRALLDLLQIAEAVCRGDRTPFSKSDELGLADLGLRFWFAVQLSRGDPLEPGLARRVVPVKDSARKSAKLIKGAKEICYPGAPHGLTATHQDRVNADLLAFLQDSVSASG